jgi:hypothetical protein
MSNLPQAFHFVRLAWLDYYNLRDIHKNGYHVAIPDVHIYDERGLLINAHRYPLPSYDLMLSFQIAIATLEKIGKSVRCYENLPVVNLEHGLRRVFADLDLEKSYPLASRRGPFSLSDITLISEDIWESILDLDYTTMRYEGKKKDNRSEVFQINIQYSKYGAFISAIGQFLQNWFDFLSSVGGHEIQFPNEIRLIRMALHAPGAKSLGETLASEDKYVIITNKPVGQLNLSTGKDQEVLGITE